MQVRTGTPAARAEDCAEPAGGDGGLGLGWGNRGLRGWSREFVCGCRVQGIRGVKFRASDGLSFNHSGRFRLKFSPTYIHTYIP